LTITTSTLLSNFYTCGEQYLYNLSLNKISVLYYKDAASTLEAILTFGDK
jgi:hypothetical protein